METVQGWIALDGPWVAVLAVVFLAGAACERALTKWSWRLRRKASPRRQGWRGRTPAVATLVPKHDPVFDGAEQLRIVERADFKTRRLLNKGEARLFKLLEQACAEEAPHWRVMAQVSLGEILTSPDERAFRAINSKRVDLLLIGPKGEPRHAVELQGSGHHIGPAATRDAVKKEALRRAGVGYIEVLPGDTPADVRSIIGKLVRQERGHRSGDAQACSSPAAGSKPTAMPPLGVSASVEATGQAQ